MNLKQALETNQLDKFIEEHNSNEYKKECFDSLLNSIACPGENSEKELVKQKAH